MDASIRDILVSNVLQIRIISNTIQPLSPNAKTGRSIILDLPLLNTMTISLYDLAVENLIEALEHLDDNAIGPHSLVALQLPSGLISKYAEFTSVIRGRYHCEAMVLLRPCYGACDIPYSFLENLNVTYLIHIGHEPMNTFTRPIPTLFIPIAIPIDTDSLSSVITELVEKHGLGGKRAVLTATAQYTEYLIGIARILEMNDVTAIIPPAEGRRPVPGQVLGCNYSSVKDADVSIFIGTGKFHPRGIAISSGKKVFAINPHAGTAAVIDGKDFLKKRASLALHLSDRKKFAVLCSPRPGQNRMELARELVKRGRKKGYKCDLVIIDEIRPEYFTGLGVDGIVSTACPRIAYDDNSLYPAPVLTPDEFLLTIGEIDIEQLTIDELD